MVGVLLMIWRTETALITMTSCPVTLEQAFP